MFDFVQPHIAGWRVRRFGGRAWRDKTARQGHVAAYRARLRAASNEGALQRPSRRRGRGPTTRWPPGAPLARSPPPVGYPPRPRMRVWGATRASAPHRTGARPKRPVRHDARGRRSPTNRAPLAAERPFP
jgi:hypothetical protein